MVRYLMKWRLPDMDGNLLNDSLKLLERNITCKLLNFDFLNNIKNKKKFYLKTCFY